jgi:hypothetical protein
VRERSPSLTLILERIKGEWHFGRPFRIPCPIIKVQFVSALVLQRVPKVLIVAWARGSRLLTWGQAPDLFARFQ